MKRFIYFLLLLLFVGCEQAPIDENMGSNTDSDELVDVVLRFGAKGHITTDVDTSITRGTMPNVADESKVYNIYVYVFNSAGRKIYGHYFDLNDSERTFTSESALKSSDKDGWYVHQAATGNQDTWGLIKFKTSKAENCTIFAITNIDSRMVNVSAEKLGLVQTQGDLLKMTATLNHDFVERTGYFPMTGYLTGVNTATVNHNQGTDDASSLKLTRMDAKVQFKIKKGDKINRLEIKNWQLCNVSRSAYIMSREARDALSGPPGDSDISGYFDTELKPYETATIESSNEVLGFSFYQLDNAKTPKQNPTSYHDRQRQEKNVDGTNGEWMFAHDNSTYVVINATIIMKTEYDFDGDGNIEEAEKGAVLNADVQYIVHLGDFSKDPADFNTLRNNVYTYTITIKGVDKVKYEVETSNDSTPNEYEEEQPGATGEVTVSLQEIFEADAHYETRVITFNEKYIKTSNEDMTWYVRTPFCKDRNEPTYDAYGTPITTGLDFRWVEFRLNKTSGGYYVANRRKYRPHPYARRYVKGNPDGEPFANAAPNVFPGVIEDGEYNGTGYVDELVEFLRAQKKLCVYTDGSYDYAKSKANGCLFDSKGDLKVTAFINEYYYERHPISGEWIDQDNSLWRRVMTLDEPRVMSILSDTKTSHDQESKIVGAAYSIRQKSIQTVYNHTNPNLTSAWGTEHCDETSAEHSTGGMYYYLDHSRYISSENRGNNDPYNGRWNTLKEWELVNNDSSFKTNQKWDTYFNFEVADGVNMLKDSYKRLRYACMTRNRDNDGDGIIDADEIRWYLASIQQLAGIYMGSNGIQPTARLYTRSAAQQNSTDPNQWREHVISSTQDGTNSNNPQLIWAEEGCSTGSITNSMAAAGYGWDGQTGYSIRCVRNVNMDDEKGYAPIAAPDDYVDVYTMKDGVKKTPVKASDTFNSGTDIYFDLQYLNSRSFRLPVGVSDSAYEPTELVMANEKHSLNNLYEAFVATNSQPSSPFSGADFLTTNQNVTNNTKNPYCPDGYRLANQRELTLMAIYAKGFMPSSVVMSRTAYSLGNTAVGGSGKDNSKYGYNYDNGVITVNNGTSGTSSRCVKDVLPQNLPK